MTPKADTEVEKILYHLRETMRRQNWSQLDIQKELGWGRSYISQLMTRQKMLRVEQVLMILEVIGVPPSEFYLELYGKDWDAWDAQWLNDDDDGEELVEI